MYICLYLYDIYYNYHVHNSCVDIITCSTKNKLQFYSIHNQVIYIMKAIGNLSHRTSFWHNLNYLVDLITNFQEYICTLSHYQL